MPAHRGRTRLWTRSSFDVENARVWGGLHYRTTMTETAKHFPQIARDVGREHFLAHP